MVKMTPSENTLLEQMKTLRWNELFFEMGYGKITENGGWHVGPAELFFKRLRDANGKSTGFYEAIIRNKLSYKGTKGQHHNSHFQQKYTGMKFVKEGKNYISTACVAVQ